MQTQNDPFITGQWGGHPCGAVTAPDRISMVRNFDLDEVEAAMQLPHLQKTVRAALQRRRRQLIKEQQS